MKSILFTLLLVCASLLLQAQVVISDSIFVIELTKLYPTCISGKILDTLCAATNPNKKIDVSLSHAMDINHTLIVSRNINEVKYFKRLKILNCSETGLHSIPELPDSLEELNAAGNSLTYLSNLPRSLKTLQISYNLITSINPGGLPDSLLILDCSNNKLTSLPLLPTKLKSLVCSSNVITVLPSLPPTLTSLACINNQIKCLPFLPDSLSSLIAGVICIPNKPPKLVISTPICTPTINKYDCHAYPFVKGKIFYDLNKNNVKDSDEYDAVNVKVNILKTDYFTYTDNSGYYEMPMYFLNGKVSLGVSSQSYYTAQDTTVDFSLNVTVNTRDFALQPVKSAKDLKVDISQTTIARPGKNLTLLLEAQNIGTIESSGILTLQIPPSYTIDSISSFGPPISGPSLPSATWSFSNLKPGQRLKLEVYGTVSYSAMLGDSLSFLFLGNPLDLEDSNLVNNSAKLQAIISNSHDPNYKQGPSTLTPLQVAKGNTVEYTIHFQNTGNDTAFAVVLADTLGPQLVANTVRLINASHPCRFSLNGNKVYFEFLNIRLVDSLSDRIKSCGFVTFQLKPQSTLTLGDLFTNRASIYFDYNSSIRTNTVVTKVEEPLLITGNASNSLSTSSRFVYPNPIENERLFVHTSTLSHVKLINSYGEIVIDTPPFSEGWDISHLAKGVYIVEVENKREKVILY
jgi:uncharacterized repeat protein (TIGR01451 family)